MSGEKPFWSRIPSHLFGGKVRTATLALCVLWLALWVLYLFLNQPDKPAEAPPSAVIISETPYVPFVPAPGAPAGQGTFREELALVSAARTALETGDASACLRAVDRYDERFRAGIFAQEIEVLRIEALAASGDRTRARALAERFLAVNAKSPYADRVRSLIERTRD